MGRSWKQFTTEKIIGILREADVVLAQEMKVGEIYRKLEVVEIKSLNAPDERKAQGRIGRSLRCVTADPGSW